MEHGLFDKMDRTDVDPAKYSEGKFEYLNRSDRPEFRTARIVLNGWYEEVVKFNPESTKDIRSRFRSNRDEQHLGALNELYLHHLLIENSFVPQAHPELRDTTKRPDFLALKDGQPQFYTEAVLAHNNRVLKRVDTFEAQISDAIDAVKSPDFFISVRVKSRSSTEIGLHHEITTTTHR